MNTALEDIWRKWDREAAQKCERIAAISNVVKKEFKSITVLMQM